MAHDKYIKISELPEKSELVASDYLVAEDLQDTWKVRASYITEYIRKQTETIEDSFNAIINRSQSFLDEVEKSHNELKEDIQEFNDAEAQRQENEMRRQESFDEMEEYIESVKDLNLHQFVEDVKDYINEVEIAEEERRQNEIQRTINETIRQQISEDLSEQLDIARDLNTKVEQNETKRQQSENERINNEKDRQELYDDMLSLRDDLMSSENDRVEAENNRVNSFNEMKEYVETTIDSVTKAEQERETAENERQEFFDDAKDFIADAEKSENDRITAEQIRVQEFEIMKQMVNGINTSTLDTGCTITPLTSNNRYAVMCSVTLDVEDASQSATDRFGMVFQIDEYNASHVLVNRCIAYLSCTVGSKFGTISLRKTASSTCSDDAVWAFPSADYLTINVGYTGSTGNDIEFKLISDSSANTLGYNRISCKVLNGVRPTTSHFVVAPITCANSPSTDTKAYGYELIIFNLYNGSMYPIGFELRTTSSSNPGDTLGGTWEMVGDGPVRTTLRTLNSAGQISSTETRTIYKWIKTA